MNRITHKYYVCKELLQKLEDMVSEKPDLTVKDLVLEFRKLKMFYSCGLVKLTEL